MLRCKVDIVFYKSSGNTYKRTFFELHYKLCDLLNKDTFLGSSIKKGTFKGPCPFPAVCFGFTFTNISSLTQFCNLFLSCFCIYICNLDIVGYIPRGECYDTHRKCARLPTAEERQDLREYHLCNRREHGQWLH